MEELVESESEAKPEETARPKKITRPSKKAAETKMVIELTRGRSKKAILAALEPSRPAPHRRKVQIEEHSEETNSDDSNLPLDERITRKARDVAHAQDLEEVLSRWKEVRSTVSSSLSASSGAANEATQAAKGASGSVNPTPLESALKPNPCRPCSNPSIDRAVSKQSALKQSKAKPAVGSSSAMTSTPSVPSAAKRSLDEVSPGLDQSKKLKVIRSSFERAAR